MIERVVKPATLKFFKDFISRPTPDKYGEESFEQGRRMAASFLAEVQADHRNEQQLNLAGIEPLPDPYLPYFEPDGLRFEGRTVEHDEEMIIVEDWNTLNALAILRMGTAVLIGEGNEDEYYDEDDTEGLRLLAEARKELPGGQTLDSSEFCEHDRANFAPGPLLLPVGEMGFSDEYDVCYECNRIVRTSPDSYSWTAPFHIFDDGELVCNECIEEDPDDYIEALINNDHKANTVLTTGALEEAKFLNVPTDFSDGWYGVNASPPNILEAVRECLPDAEFVFHITGVGQFETNFDLWARGEGVTEEVLEALAEAADDADDGPNIAENFRKATQNINFSKSQAIKDHAEQNGITVIELNLADGTSEQRSVSAQDFIAGKALKK